MRIMKMTGRLSAVLLSAVLSLSMLSGCGRDASKGNDESINNTPTEAETTTTAPENQNKPENQDSPENQNNSENPDNPANTPAETGDNGTEDDIIPKETVTLTVFSEQTCYMGEQLGWFGQILKDKFNVKLNIESGDPTYRFENKDMGDIVVFGCVEDYLTARDAGLLLDWEKNDLLAKHGAYMKDNVSLVLEKNRSLNPDGKIYGLRQNFAAENSYEDPMFTWDIRWDLYEKLGHPEVKDLDDLYDLFVKMKEICPTDKNGNPSYAFSLWSEWDSEMLFYPRMTASAYYGYDLCGMGLYDYASGKYVGALDEDSPYISILEFYNKLYRNGLLDPDSATNNYDAATEKVKNSGVFCNILSYAGSNMYNTDDHISENKIMRTLIPSSASPVVYDLSVYGSDMNISIGAGTKYPDLCMEIINYLTTPEGRMTMGYGPKGVTWDYDSDGYLYLTELGLKVHEDPSLELNEKYTGAYWDGASSSGWSTWHYYSVNIDSKAGETYYCDRWQSFAGEPLNDADADWREFNGGIKNVDGYLNKVHKNVSHCPESETLMIDEDIKDFWSQVSKCICEYSWKAIYAENEEEFSKIIEEMKTQAALCGYEECNAWSKEKAK